MKTIIVCGGSRGIGLATTRKLLSQGHKVIVLSRSNGELTEEELKQPSLQVHHVDFTNREERSTVIKKLQSVNGLWGIVNNSGGPKRGALVDSSIDQFESAMESHLFSSHELTMNLLPLLKINGGGRIVNIISITAKVPALELGVSNTLRGAMLNWSKTLSNEAAQYGITVNNVLPGYTKTQRLKEVIQNPEQEKQLIAKVPMKRLAEPSEVANVACFLLSEEASYVTGVSIAVDGGLTPST
jgi:3-oxoacyl-[acyl-carrier protein] reductase